jgi:FHS family L-fucose permease-like MFS transporter
MPSMSLPVDAPRTAPKQKLSFAEMFRTADGKSQLFVFILVSTLFGLWGFCNGQLEVLNRQFQNSLRVSIALSTLVQFVNFIGYAIMAIPAGILTRRYGYKGGILIGLGLVATGAFWFIPATKIDTYAAFLAGLFIIAFGLACLETVANPYTTVLGPPEGAAARINLAQTCNGLGVTLGPLVASKIMLSSTSEVNRSNQNLYIPYLAIAVVVTILFMIFAFSKIPDVHEQGVETTRGRSKLAQRPHFIFAVVAQFFYVGAQIALWALFINYLVSETPPMSASLASLLPHGWTYEKGGLYFISDQTAGKFLSVAFVLFLLGRFTGSMALRTFSANKTLAVYGFINTVLMALVVARLGWLSVGALFLSNFFMSIMFPTIFSLGIRGLGEDTKQASSFIVMSIGGGAIFPVLNGWISGHFSMAVGFVVPLICFAVVAFYGAYWERLFQRSRVG